MTTAGNLGPRKPAFDQHQCAVALVSRPKLSGCPQGWDLTITQESEQKEWELNCRTVWIWMILINLRIEAVDGPSIRTILSKRWESASGIDFACAETRLTTCIHRQIVGPQVVWATGPISGLPNILGSFLVYIYIIYIHIYNHIHTYIYGSEFPNWWCADHAARTCMYSIPKWTSIQIIHLSAAWDAAWCLKILGTQLCDRRAGASFSNYWAIKQKTWLNIWASYIKLRYGSIWVFPEMGVALNHLFKWDLPW